MTDEQPPDAAQEDPPQELDRIRDIIFGTQMRDYQQQFQVIQRDLARLQKEIDRLTEELAEQDSSQSKKLQALRRETGKGDDELRSELRQTAQELTNDKVDRETLGELLIELGTRLKTSSSLSDLLRTVVETDQDQGRDG